MDNLIIKTNKKCKNYSLINEIVDNMLSNESTAQILYKDPEEILEFLLKTPDTFSEIHNSKESVIELKAISLRLSRHHMKRANFIEKIARVIAEVIYETNLKIIIQNFEYADRPSIMVINRTIQILNIKYNISNSLTIEMSDFKSENKLLFKMRDNLFNNLYTKNTAFRKAVTTSTEKEELLFDLDYNSSSLDMALLEQNYELAYLILISDHEKGSQSLNDQMFYRWIGVICANLSFYEEAHDLLFKAIQYSEGIIDKARNTYIFTLHLTKRMNKPEESIKLIKEMLVELETFKDKNSDDFLHEKAWLKNGLSLAQTLNSKSIEEDAIGIIKNEMESYETISNSNNFKFVYLKYNLLANIAFLLEILKEYNQAEQFWERAFGKLFLDEKNNLDGVKSLSYRLGVLNIKMNNLEKAKEKLMKAKKLSKLDNNDFHVLNINYALNYINFLESNNDEIFIKENIDLANFLNDIYYKEAFESLFNSEGTPPPPKLKLISYVSNIDLSFVPKEDMNEKLDTFNWRHISV